jgi:hypothetical protein
MSGPPKTSASLFSYAPRKVGEQGAAPLRVNVSDELGDDIVARPCPELIVRLRGIDCGLIHLSDPVGQAVVVERFFDPADRRVWVFVR